MTARYLPWSSERRTFSRIQWEQRVESVVKLTFAFGAHILPTLLPCISHHTVLSLLKLEMLSVSANLRNNLIPGPDFTGGKIKVNFREAIELSSLNGLVGCEPHATFPLLHSPFWPANSCTCQDCFLSCVYFIVRYHFWPQMPTM